MDVSMLRLRPSLLYTPGSVRTEPGHQTDEGDPAMNCQPRSSVPGDAARKLGNLGQIERDMLQCSSSQAIEL